MKTVKWLVSFCLTFTFFATVVKGSTYGTIDGSYKSAYGSALATQVLATVAGDSTIGLIDAANGSELDAAYGIVSNGVLYLFLAGNLDTASTGAVTGVAYDKLNVFIDAAGAANNTLGTNYNGGFDFGHFNNMGVAGNGRSGEGSSPGLTFDTGFNPNYWIGVTAGAVSNITSYANYLALCVGCDGFNLGFSAPSNTIFDISGRNTGIRVALNNSNTNGVWGDINGCPGTGVTTNNPLVVNTGVEMAIPLYDLGSPVGLSSISVCAFVVDDQYVTMYNQVLGPVTGDIGNSSTCAFQLSPDGDTSDVNFNNLPGKHYFTIPIPPCSVVNLSPNFSSFDSTGGVGSVAVTMDSGCGYVSSVDPSSTWITITSGGSGTGGGVGSPATLSYSVSTNTSVYPRTGFFNVVGSSQSVTTTVTITQSGLALPALTAFAVDGTLDTNYGCALVVQQVGTQYGKNNSTNVFYTSGGNELDSAYGLVQNNTLFLFVGGNISGGNHIHFFFSTGAPGINSMTNVEPGVEFGMVNAFAETNNGVQLIFDPSFIPNYWMDMNVGGSTPANYQLFVNYAQLWPGGTNAAGVATNGFYLGSTPTPTNGNVALSGGANPWAPAFVRVAINNSNTNGVDGSGCYTNGTTLLPNSVSVTNPPSGVTTGFELAIPLAALGSPTGAIHIVTFIDGGWPFNMSNQLLPGIATNGCTSNLSGGDGNIINLGGGFLQQPYFSVGPEMRITSVTITNVLPGPPNVTNKDVNVKCLTESSTNLLYELQRTYAPLLTNSVWSTISSFQTGTGGIITFLDTSNPGTNKVGVMYRVLQQPNTCAYPQ